MHLAHPEWLLLLVVFGLLAWRWPTAGLLRPLRLACLVLVTALLCGPSLRRLQDGMDLWVLVDQSASAAESLAVQSGEWQALVERHRGPRDRLFFLDYAAEPIVRGEDETLAYTGGREWTRTASAIRFALNRMDPARSSRILLWTDGFSTETLADIPTRLAEDQVPLDYRLAMPLNAVDYRIESLRAPESVQPREPFILEASVRGNRDADAVPYSLSRNGERIHTGNLPVRGGRGTIRVTLRIDSPGAHRHEIRIHPEEDAHPGNNHAEVWVEATGDPRILLVTAYENDPVATVLRRQGFMVETETRPDRLHPGRLSGVRALIFNNIPAHLLPAGFMDDIAFFVREQGGGLVMGGGRQSFGSGGYFGSPLEELLPVSMELRQEHRKLAVAMAVVLDRSGSMNAGLPGAAGMTKMDLANAGTARAIELLGPHDAVTVFAVDTQAHEILPLTTLGNNRDELLRVVRRIASRGGGIYVYTGIKAGWEQLAKSSQGQRHFILFADAADAEEPGGYVKLIEEMTAQGVTISVIGLGRESDKDVEFLRDIAARGNGRVFITDDASVLPELFAQETVAVARSAFVDDPVTVVAAAGWLEIAGGLIPWPEVVAGYNLSYLKEDATGASFTGDEYAAPLVAFSRRGLGRVAAVTFPLAGPDAAGITAWTHYGDFLQTLGRWGMGDDMPRGLALQTRIVGGELEMNLHHSGHGWEERLALQAPSLRVGSGRRVGEVPWEHIRPGHYRARHPLPPGEVLKGAVSAGTHALAFGPVSAGIHAEWDFNPDKISELRNVSLLSGGRERLDFSTVWEVPPKPALRPLWTELLILLVLLFVADVAVTRWFGGPPSVSTAGHTGIDVPGPVRKSRTRNDPPGREDQSPHDAAPPSVKKAPRRSVLTRAKRRGR